MVLQTDSTLWWDPIVHLNCFEAFRIKWQHWRETYLDQSKPHSFNLIPQIIRHSSLAYIVSVRFYFIDFLFFFIWFMTKLFACFMAFNIIHISSAVSRKFTIYSNTKDITIIEWFESLECIAITHYIHSISYLRVFKNDGIYDLQLSYLISLSTLFCYHIFPHHVRIPGRQFIIMR